MRTAKLSWWFLLENWVILTQKSWGRLYQRNLGFFPPAFQQGVLWNQNIWGFFLTWKHHSIVFYCSQLLRSLLCTLIFGVIYRQRLSHWAQWEFDPWWTVTDSSPLAHQLSALSGAYSFPFKGGNDAVLMDKARALGFISELLQTPSNSFNVCACCFLHLDSRWR